MKSISVSLPGRAYTLSIGSGAMELLAETIRGVSARASALVVSDEHVAPLYMRKILPQLEAAQITADALVLPAGETTKSFEALYRIYEALAGRGMGRSDVLVALGGGVIGDLAAYAAATWQRGMKLIQCPTTLLAQIDSSIGGKAAVNTPWGKNLVGAFKQPDAVLADTEALRTLSDADFASGMAEVVKTACLKSRELFDRIADCGGRQGIMPQIGDIIAECCDYKRGIVEFDELDLGGRMALNFGHTLAHALEPVGNWTRWTHGQAVAIGMVKITECSERAQLTVKGTSGQIARVLALYGLGTKWPDVDPQAVYELLKLDKKAMSGGITLSLIHEIGRPFLYSLSLDELDEFFALSGRMP